MWSQSHFPSILAKSTGIYLEKGRDMDPNRPLEDLRRAVEDSPDSGESWRQLVEALWKNGAEEALCELDRCHGVKVDKPLAVASWKAKLRAMGLGQLSTTPFRHEGEIYAIWATSQGEWITGSSDGLIQVWNRDGEKVRTLEGHKGTVTSLFYQPGGERLASTSSSGEVFLWDFPDGQVVQTLARHRRRATSVIITRDGKVVVSAGLDNSIRVSSSQTGEEILVFDRHQHGVTSLTLTNDDKLVASGDESGACVVWVLASGKVGKGFPSGEEAVTALDFSANKRHLLTGSESGVICLWDAALGKELQRWEEHEDKVNKLYFIRDDQEFLSASSDGTVRRFDMVAGIETHNWEIPRMEVYAMGWNPENNLIAAGGDQCHLQLLDVESGDRASSIYGPTRPVVDMDCGIVVATAGNGDYCQWWNSLSGMKLGEIFCPRSGMGTLSLSPDNRFLVTGGKDGKARVWEVATGELLREFEGHEGPINTIRFHPDGQRVISGDKMGHVIVWYIEHGHVRAKGDLGMGQIYRAQFFPMTEYVVVATDKNLCLVMDLANAEEVARFEGHESPVRDLVITDTEMVVSGGNDQTVRIWEGNTGREVAVFIRHFAPVRSLCLLERGFVVVSGDEEGWLLAWDVEEDTKVFERPFPAAVTSVRSHPHEEDILVGLADGQLFRISQYTIY